MFHSKRPVWVYYAALLFVVVFWGVSAVVYHYFYRHYSAAVLTTVMTFFSAAFFLDSVNKKLGDINKNFLKVTIPICLLNAFANVFYGVAIYAQIAEDFFERS